MKRTQWEVNEIPREIRQYFEEFETECGKPWVRVVERTGHVNKRETAHVPGNTLTKIDSTGWAPVSMATDRWQAGCKCEAGEPRPTVVLDPFCGSGTTLMVADRLGRDGIGIELNGDYAELARLRITQDSPMFAKVEVIR